jgi:hypothetical protein
MSSITFFRLYTQQGNWDSADALLQYALHAKGCKEMLVIADVDLVVNKESFVIDEEHGIKFEVVNYDRDNSKPNGLKSIEFKVFSPFNAVKLREWCAGIRDEFKTFKASRIGNKRYFFDQNILPPQGSRGRNVSERLTFTKHEFTSKRTLDNVFGDQVVAIKKRLDIFMNRPEWYAEHGIPHTFGLLLHGEPGCGKTSTARAIANMTNRHVVNVNMSQVRTKKQLKTLLLDEDIIVAEDVGSKETAYSIPIKNRIYVIEDMDCQQGNEVGLRRDLAAKKRQDIMERAQNAHKGAVNYVMAELEEELDLATFLNVLDGMLETPGRIIIMTSNQPDKLDGALIRPGRIDMIVKYGRISRKNTVKMVEHFYRSDHVTITDEVASTLPDKRWTPAEVTQVLFQYIDEPSDALHHLATESPDPLLQVRTVDPVSPSPILLELHEEHDDVARGPFLPGVF